MPSEQMNSGNFLQLVREDVPGVYNPGGERTVMTSLRGEFAPEEAWASFRASGWNEDAWHAMERTHAVFTGTIRWDYKQAPTLLRMVCGAPHAVTTSGGVRSYEYRLPETGARDLDGSTFTLEYGKADSCARHTYGIVTSISLPAERSADTVEGQITIICKKAEAEGVPMSGTLEQSDIFEIALADQSSSHVINIAGTDITIETGDGAAELQGKIRALGGDWANAIVSAA